MFEEFNASPWLRRLIVVVLLGGLLLLSYVVLKPFLVPVIWALILAYVTWPLYARLRRLLRGQATLSALLMTLLLTAAFVLPVLWLVSLMRSELLLAYEEVTRYIATHPQLPATLRGIPWLGEVLQEFIDRVGADPAGLKTELARWLEQSLVEVRTLVGGLGRNVAKTFFALLTVFFAYRNGEQFVRQVRAAMEHLLGERVQGYTTAIGDTTRAVVYGLVLAAIAQGTLAGLGYWAAGLQAPVLLGAATAVIALVPFGAPLIWGSVGVWLLLTDRTGAGIGLLLWGALAVSWIDNLIRPLVISNQTRIPFLLVLFGVLGGIAAFGLVGLFVGPVILAILMAVWREWLHVRQPIMETAPAAPPREGDSAS
jgi:predicted PurR-regulated permease PerM